MMSQISFEKSSIVITNKIPIKLYTLSNLISYSDIILVFDY